MDDCLIAKLTAKDERFACALTEKITKESRESDTWYPWLDTFVLLLDHSNSFVRNRALSLLAANAQWDEENRFDAILPSILSHIIDPKPITARQCVKALAEIGQTKPKYIDEILAAFEKADLSKYKDSMRPLIEKDIRMTQKILSEMQ